MPTVNDINVPLPISDLLTDFSDPAQKKIVQTFLEQIDDGDSNISYQEYFNTFYKDDGTYSYQQDQLCSPVKTAERLLGNMPSMSNFTNVAEGQKAIITWTQKYQLLGQLSDAIQRRFGIRSDSFNYISVGHYCEAKLISSNPPKTEAKISQVPPTFNYHYDLRDDAYQKIQNALDDVCDANDNLLELDMDLSLAQDEGIEIFAEEMRNVAQDILAVDVALTRVDSLLDQYGDLLDDEAYNHFVANYNEEAAFFDEQSAVLDEFFSEFNDSYYPTDCFDVDCDFVQEQEPYMIYPLDFDLEVIFANQNYSQLKIIQNVDELSCKNNL